MAVGASMSPEVGSIKEPPPTPAMAVGFFDPALKGVRSRVAFRLGRMGKSVRKRLVAYI